MKDKSIQQFQSITVRTCHSCGTYVQLFRMYLRFIPECFQLPKMHIVRPIRFQSGVDCGYTCGGTIGEGKGEFEDVLPFCAYAMCEVISECVDHGQQFPGVYWK